MRGKDMRKINAFYIPAVFAVLFSSAAFSQSVTISQVDNSTLLQDQKIRLYVSVTDDGGYPLDTLEKDGFSVMESVKGGKDMRREIVDFKKGANKDDGITFIFMLDNSGSMYDTGDGKSTDVDDLRKIAYAKNALKGLLKDMTNPKDRFGFISFNLRMDAEVQPTGNKQGVLDAIDQVGRPEKNEAYTEIYESLYSAANELETVRARKVIILLSDGENFPRKDNPYFQVRHGLDGAVELSRKVGVSVFTIGLSRQADKAALTGIANKTGGAYFSAYNPEELAGLYNLIRNRILNEYLLSYYATMDPAEIKTVKVSCAVGPRPVAAERDYFSDTLFGKPQAVLNPFMFLAVAASLIVLALLALLKFERKQAEPSLEVLTVDGRRKTTLSLTIAADKKEITIGGSQKADITITGARTAPESEVTIQNSNGVFTIAGTEVTVNNKKVRNKALRSGDLIKVGNTTIVFDEGVKTRLRDKSK
jgi:Ca-activated chloride channel homolog